MKRFTLYITLMIFILSACASGKKDSERREYDYEIYLATTEGEDGGYEIDYNTADLQVYKEKTSGKPNSGSREDIKWTVDGKELEFEYSGKSEISGNRYWVDDYMNWQEGIGLSFYEDTTDLAFIHFIYGNSYTIGQPVDSETMLLEFADQIMQEFQGSVEGLERSVKTEWNGEHYDGFYVPTDYAAEDVRYIVRYVYRIDGIRTVNSPYVIVSGEGALNIVSLGNSDAFAEYTDVTVDQSQIDVLIKDTVETMCNTDEYALNTYITNRTLRIVDGELFVQIIVFPTLEEKESGKAIEPTGLKFLIPIEEE